METKLLSWKGPKDGVVKGFLTTDPDTVLFRIRPVMTPWDKEYFLIGSFLPASAANNPCDTFEAAQTAAEEYLRAWVGKHAATICPGFEAERAKLFHAVEVGTWIAQFLLDHCQNTGAYIEPDDAAVLTGWRLMLKEALALRTTTAEKEKAA